MEVEAIVVPGVCSPERGLNISRRADSNVNRTIEVELVVEDIIIITNCGGTADNECNILSHANICKGQMALEGIAGVEFEHAKAAWMDMGCFSGNVRSVEVGGICRAIKAADQLIRCLTEPILAVEERI